jgi:FkbM family methyltransferase
MGASLEKAWRSRPAGRRADALTTTVRAVSAPAGRDPALHPPRPAPTLAFRAYESLGRSALAIRAALRLRNICDALIGARLNEGIDPERNGEAWLVRATAPHADVVVDVGANTGAWSRLFLAHGESVSRAVLFEPARVAFRELQAVFDVDDRVTCLNAAVSDSVGTMPFYEEPAAGETSSLLRGHSRPDARLDEVDVTTLDATLEQQSIDQVDVLKIDAEGYDLQVLRGASNALAAHRLKVIQFEYNRPWALAGSTLGGAMELLESNGYTVLLLRSSGLHEFDYDTYGEFLSYANFVAIAPGAGEMLEPHIRGRI